MEAAGVRAAGPAAMSRRTLLAATATPLASIFGSGFLIIVPVLEAASGRLAVGGVALVCLAGAAESLGERDRDEVERRGQRRRVLAAGGGGVEHPGAVEVAGGAVLAGDGRDGLELGAVSDEPAHAVVRVLDLHERGGREQQVPARPAVVNCTPALAAAAPVSCQTAWLAIVPVGTNSPACLPSSAATRSCSALTLGSSPNARGVGVPPARGRLLPPPLHRREPSSSRTPLLQPASVVCREPAFRNAGVPPR